MNETTLTLFAVGGLLTPIVLAAFSRDRTLFSMITHSKEEMRAFVDATVNPLNERIDRVRNEYVRRDDLSDHLTRIEKRFDNIQERLDDIRDRLTA